MLKEIKTKQDAEILRYYTFTNPEGKETEIKYTSEISEDFVKQHVDNPSFCCYMSFVPNGQETYYIKAYASRAFNINQDSAAYRHIGWKWTKVPLSIYNSYKKFIRTKKENLLSLVNKSL